MTIQDFIVSRRYLVWYVKNPATLSEESIVEAVLNYGDWNDFREMIHLLGVGVVADIFRKTVDIRGSYRPEVKNYFSLYFDKYAS